MVIIWGDGCDAEQAEVIRIRVAQLEVFLCLCGCEGSDLICRCGEPSILSQEFGWNRQEPNSIRGR